jgi:hypothetical protein
MRKDVREFIRRLEAVGLTVEVDAGALPRPARRQAAPQAERDAVHAAVLPDTIRWRRTAIVELRKLGIDL